VPPAIPAGIVKGIVPLFAVLEMEPRVIACENEPEAFDNCTLYELPELNVEVELKSKLPFTVTKQLESK
jgi:hypothetical protein